MLPQLRPINQKLALFIKNPSRDSLSYLHTIHLSFSSNPKFSIALSKFLTILKSVG